MSPTYYQNLTISLLNLYAWQIAEEGDSDSCSVLYKGLSEADQAKNNCLIELVNVSDDALDIIKGTVIKIYWRSILTPVADESSLIWAPKKGWTIEFSNTRNSRFWMLTAQSDLSIRAGSRLKFEISGVKASQSSTPPPLSLDSSTDIARLSFGLYPPNETKAATECSSVVALKRLDASEDAEALPINVSFTKPRNPVAPDEWNVSQNQLCLNHPTKRDNEVYCNTINGLIESRLGFSIRNPSGSPLVRKSANADPRFVVTMAYGNNVRALSKLQEGLPEDRLLDNGPSDGDGSPTIEVISPSKAPSAQNVSGIELINDGMDNSSGPITDASAIAFTQTESDNAGIKTWTLRPPKGKNVVLDSQHELRWVFNGICPDDTVGKAVITIAYYDIRGYKDGYLTICPNKIQPVPFLIFPRSAMEVAARSRREIKLSWQFFGLDQITILHKLRDGIQIGKTENLPAVANDYTIKLKDQNLWQHHQLVVEVKANDGGTVSYTFANVRYEVAFSLDMRKDVYYTDWQQLKKYTKCISEVMLYYKVYFGGKRLDRVAGIYRTIDKNLPWCRYTLRHDSTSWILSLEIWYPVFYSPVIYHYTRMPGEDKDSYYGKTSAVKELNKEGGGYFPLDNINYLDDGDFEVSFEVAIEHLSSTTGIISTSKVVSYCKIDPSSNDILMAKNLIQGLNSPIGGSSFEPYCLYPSTKPLKAGKKRPMPLPKYTITGDTSSPEEREFDTLEEAKEAWEQIHGGLDGSPSGEEFIRFKPNHNIDPRKITVSSSSRSLEPQDFHDQILQAHDFHEADLDQANFDQADLQGANLRRASLREASLQGAKLVMVNGSRASLRESNLEAALLNYANFEQATFESANLSGASFFGANLTEALFIGANLTEANFDGAIVEGAVFDTGSGLSAEQLEALRQRGAKVLDCPEPRYTPDDLDPASDPEAIP